MAPGRGRVGRFLAQLGPGVISGAANDDPSCISTFSVAAAAYGYATLWTSPFCLPLIAAVQLMCARLGIVTGRGLGGVIRRHMPRWVLIASATAVFAANAINLGADLGGMAEATEMLTGVPWWVWTPAYALGLLAMLFWSSYRRIVWIFRWLALVLFAYIAAAVLARPDWGEVLRATLVPRVEFSPGYLAALVGILGATLSPYVLFWQAAQEVEEEYTKGRHTVGEREGASKEELERSRTDVMAGAFISRLITYFLTITTAATVHAAGNTHIATARDAAAALKPIAGESAYWLFAVGLIGTGMLAVPVLAGSSAYAVSDAAAWRGSLEKRPKLARRFYRVVALSMLLGMGLKLAGFSAVSMLFWAAVVNGAIAAPLILIVVLLTSRRDVMGPHTTAPLVRWLGYASVALTGAAAIAMLAMFVAR